MQKVIERKSFDPEDMLASAVILGCIDPAKKQIKILDIFDIKITNEIICKYLGSDWLGVEVKFLPELQKSIKKLADGKKKEEEKDIEKILSMLRGNHHNDEEDEYDE